MGHLRRDSDRIRQVRLRLEAEDRETLLPCPACDGAGKRMLELADGRYRQWSCAWCGGIGATTAMMIRAFRRWLGIAHWNRLRRPCGKFYKVAT